MQYNIIVAISSPQSTKIAVCTGPLIVIALIHHSKQHTAHCLNSYRCYHNGKTVLYHANFKYGPHIYHVFVKIISIYQKARERERNPTCINQMYKEAEDGRPIGHVALATWVIHWWQGTSTSEPSSTGWMYAPPPPQRAEGEPCPPPLALYPVNWPDATAH